MVDGLPWVSSEMCSGSIYQISTKLAGITNWVQRQVSIQVACLLLSQVLNTDGGMVLVGDNDSTISTNGAMHSLLEKILGGPPAGFSVCLCWLQSWNFDVKILDAGKIWCHYGNTANPR